MPAAIEASNVEMKSPVDPEEGLQAQKDSFSLANVVPQLQRHNAPIWAKLEDECLEAARRLGTTVGVVSGPVYAVDAACRVDRSWTRPLMGANHPPYPGPCPPRANPTSARG